MWITMAWQCISPDMIVKGFKKCCISNAMDGTDNGMLWNNSEEDGNVRSECDKDLGTAYEARESDTDV
jgi:hypothetical protein